MAGSAAAADLHVLVFNLQMDVEDPVLAFATRWVETLAERVRKVTVITMQAGTVRVPDNVRVYSVGRERGLSEPHRAIAFERLAARVCERDRPDVVFSHMITVFATLFAPLRLRYRIPVLLWYAHGAVPLSLRVAHRVVDRCVTSSPGGFRLPSRKLHVLSQGIDTRQLLQPVPRPAEWARTIVSVGRIAAVKRLHEAIDALALLVARGGDARLELFGAPSTTADAAYQHELQARIAAHGLESRVRFAGPVRFDEIRTAYAAGAVHVNLSRHGPYDKALLESIVAGCVPVSDNESFRRVAEAARTPHLVPGDGPDALATTLQRALALSGSGREEVVGRLRDIVVRDHSLDGVIERITGHLEDLAAASR